MTVSRFYFLCMLLLVGAAATLFHLNPDNFLADDAYFYPQIADQIVQGHGSTFHQYTATNGYQPLWMVVCIIAAWAAQGDKIFLLHLLAVVQVVLFLAAIYFLYRLTREAEIRFVSVGIALLAVLMLAFGGLRLFEAHLAIALQMWSLYLLWKMLQTTPSAFMLGSYSVLLGFVFLARTDAFFFSAFCGVALGIAILKEKFSVARRAIRIALVAVPALGVALSYMMFNLWAFGHPVPVSGVIKSSFPHVHIDWHALGMQGTYIVPFTLFLLVLGAGLSSRQRIMRVLFVVLFLAVSFHAAYLICFSWGSQWYYTTAFTALPLVVPFMLTAASGCLVGSRGFNAVVSLATVAFFGTMVAVGYMKTRYNFSVSLWASGQQRLEKHTGKSARMRLVDKINTSIPPGAGMAVFDTPGVLAYFTHVRILPLDGLVNDRAYDKEVVAGGIGSYLRRQGIRYFLTANMPEGEEYRSTTLRTVRKGTVQENTVFAPLQKEAAGTLFVDDSQIVFEADNPIPGNHAFVSVCCWDVSSSLSP